MIEVLLFDFFDVIHADHQKAWLAAHGYKREGGFAEASDLLDAGQIDFEAYLVRYAALAGTTPAAAKRWKKQMFFLVIFSLEISRGSWLVRFPG